MDYTIFAHFFLLAVCIAAVAVTYLNILPFEQPFNRWFEWGHRFKRYFFYRPIFVCEKCFAGQVALWGWPLALLFEGNIQTYSPLQHVFFISLTILVTFDYQRQFLK